MYKNKSRDINYAECTCHGTIVAVSYLHPGEFQKYYSKW